MALGLQVLTGILLLGTPVPVKQANQKVVPRHLDRTQVYMELSRP